MKSSYFKRMSALVLSLAICISFMPFVSVTAYAADGGEWYLISMDDYNTYYIDLEEGQDTTKIDIKDYFKIEPDEESENPLTYDSFEYQWQKMSDDEEEYINIEGEASPVLSDVKEGSYRCVFTNKDDAEDEGYAYFRVNGENEEETSGPAITNAVFTSNGFHEIKEYTHGYFTRDGRWDANDNFIPESDYYYNYSSDDEGEEYSSFFNIGDKLTVTYEDNTTDVFTYQEKEMYDEDEGHWTSRGFINNDGIYLEAWGYLYNNNQSYATRLGVGSTLNAQIKVYGYTNYDEEMDESYNVPIDVNNYAKIVKNPGAVWLDGAFYKLNYYEKSADLQGFYKNNVSAFTIPAEVTMGDGKSYPVRHLSSYIWEYDSSLKQLTVPSSVHDVDDFAFGLTETYDSNTKKWIAKPIDGFTLYAATGSAAYEYAKEYGITVIDNNAATNGTALAQAQANAEAKAQEAAAAQAAAEAAKKDSGAKSQEAAAAKAEAETKAKEAEAAKNELAALKAQLKKIKGFKATAKKKGKAQIKWKKTAGVTGYQVYRSTKKSSGFKKVATIKKVSTLKWNDKKLKKGKKYYYKVRTYTVVNGKNYYGQWSEVKSIKGKK